MTHEEPTPALPPTGRHETEAERIDRNVAELLQELRVAGLGIQVLFGFLLAMPFTNLFSTLSLSRTTIAFRFTPLDGTGAWRVDDVYLDPRMK